MRAEQTWSYFSATTGGAVPLEVAAVEQAGGDLLVIHAMRLRAKYAAAYAEVRPWQRP